MRIDGSILLFLGGSFSFLVELVGRLPIKMRPRGSGVARDAKAIDYGSGHDPDC